MGRASDAPVVASAGTQAEPRTPASWLLFADRSQTAAPLPVGSDPRSVRRTEPFHKAPLPSSPALGRYAKGLPCCRNFTPAQPDRPAASMRDFCSGAYNPVLTVWQAMNLLHEVHVQCDFPETSRILAEAEIALLNLVLALARWDRMRLISS